MRWDALSIVVLLGGAGVVLLCRPAIGLGWARAAHPEIPADNQFGLLIGRIVGAMALGIAVLFLASMLHAA